LLLLLLIVSLPGSTRKPEASAEEATLAGAEVITNSIGMKLTLIPAGEFMMGSRETPEELAKAFTAYGAVRRSRMSSRRTARRSPSRSTSGHTKSREASSANSSTTTGYETDAQKCDANPSRCVSCRSAWVAPSDERKSKVRNCGRSPPPVQRNAICRSLTSRAGDLLYMS
jgi:hypothetical protein